MNKKKLIAILTLVCFMFTLVPVAVMAESETLAIEEVQKLIDILPNADNINNENVEAVIKQLEIIDEKKVQLSDEETTMLVIDKYIAVVERVTTLAGEEVGEAEEIVLYHSTERAIAEAKKTYGQEDNENFWYIGKDKEFDAVYAYLTANADDTYTLSVVGSGEMMSPGVDKAFPWHKAGEDVYGKIKAVYIGKDILTLGYSCFMSLSAMESITFEKGSELTTVEYGSFAFTSALKEVVFPAYVESVGTSAFYKSNVETIEFEKPGSLRTIEGAAFMAASELVYFNNPNKSAECEIFPPNVTFIGSGAFQSASKMIGKVTIPKEIKSLSWTFYGLQKISSITFAEGSQLETIGKSTFQGCSGVSELTLPETVTTIGENAFYGMKGLTEIRIPASVESIGKYAFRDCSKLNKVTIPENSQLKTIGGAPFAGCGNLKNSVYLPEGLKQTGAALFQQVPVPVIVLPSTIEKVGSLVHANGKTIFDFSRVDDTVSLKKTIGNVSHGSVVYLTSEERKEGIRSSSSGSIIYMITNGGRITSTAYNYTDFPTLEREGYTFLNKWTDSKGNELSKFPTTGNANYYAQWAATISFDANDGTGTAMADIVILETETAALTQNTFTRENYIFDGWNTERDGSGVSYADGATISGENGDTVLYAQWKKELVANSYTVEAIVDQTYTGQEIKPTVLVKDSNGYELASSAYEVEYSVDGNDFTNVTGEVITVTVTMGDKNSTISYEIIKDESPIISMDNVEVIYGTNYEMVPAAMTSTGYAIDAPITIKYYTDKNCTDGESAEPPTEVGTYYAKATLTGNSNYAPAEKVATIRISNNTLDIDVEGYTGVYDGKPHSISVKSDGATITYSKDGRKYSDEKPTYTNAGTYKVYYKVEKPNFTTTTGSVNVVITKAMLNVAYVSEVIAVGETPALAIAVTGFVNNETPAFLEDAYIAPIVKNDNTEIGVYELTPANGEATNYDFIYESGNLEITKANTTVVPSTDKNENIVTYGDSITLTAQVTTSQMMTFALTAEPDEVAFYNGDEQLGNPVAVIYDNENQNIGTATLTFNTIDQEFSVGDNIITAVYGGSVNLNGSESDTITVTLKAKELSVTGLIATDKEYDGTTEVVLISGELEGVLDGDDVDAIMPTIGTVESADAGENKAVSFDTIVLTGEDAGYYALVQPTVTVNITAVPEDTTPSTSSSSGGFSGSYNYPVSTPTVDNGEVKLSDSNAVAGESVTATVTPDNGYGVAEVIVTDEDGNIIPVEFIGNGQYTFVMPAGKVDIEVVCKPAITMSIGDIMLNIFGDIVYNDVAPTIGEGNRTMLPIRAIANALGAEVYWDAETQKVTIVKDGKVIEVFIGKDYAFVDGERIDLDAKAYIENSRTYLQVRFITEALDADVIWDPVKKTVTIIPN